ncbi:hypothetical protein IGI04_018479 [Brassica rapa subsp. trilocularis]|uniref:Uncharacterized protein n=1 Tax=Brassica rapa subsp. trilocularis TaxID=1813537 RepID=A0ABQ7ME81_BRACM|nr:hypothetical protein IGI04_018479 [Brassica rapa subsp. trilocularis]
MSSSHLAIFCVILIALFSLHEFVDGQGANAGFCVPVNCDTNDKNRSCATCHIASPRKTLIVDGQGANAGFCVPVNCDTNDKNRSCATCHIASPRKTLSFKSLAECKAGCKA